MTYAGKLWLSKTYVENSWSSMTQLGHRCTCTLEVLIISAPHHILLLGQDEELHAPSNPPLLLSRTFSILIGCGLDCRPRIGLVLLPNDDLRVLQALTSHARFAAHYGIQYIAGSSSV